MRLRNKNGTDNLNHVKNKLRSYEFRTSEKRRYINLNTLTEIWYYNNGNKICEGKIDSEEKLYGSPIDEFSLIELIEDYPHRLGMWTWYHRNSSKKNEGEYGHTGKTGKWVEYYKNGQIKETGNYNNENPYLQPAQIQ